MTNKHTREYLVERLHWEADNKGMPPFDGWGWLHEAADMLDAAPHNADADGRALPAVKRYGFDLSGGDIDSEVWGPTEYGSFVAYADYESLARRVAEQDERIKARPSVVIDMAAEDRADLECQLAAAPAVPREIRLNDDGTLDEVVGSGVFHLEQMDKDHWWMELDGVSVWLHSSRKITATYEDRNADQSQGKEASHESECASSGQSVVTGAAHPHNADADGPLPVEVAEAIADARMLCRYAYEQGFHELGYDPVRVLERQLAAVTAERERLETQEWETKCLLVIVQAERDALKQDAERWRYFCEMDHSDMLHMVASGTNNYNATIDAALATPADGKTGNEN